MFTERLKLLRTEKRISQSLLATHLGVTQQAIARWEKGETEPDISTIQNLASFFGVSTDYLLGRTDERNPGSSTDDWPPEAKVLFRDVKKLTPEQLELVTKLVKEFINED
ncbi:MAG: helix-turn-helix transcriptional regulator [Clostridiaceae bacterium]|nr:helix-turn-helix transcriptional regulator [Clostridiaceae bacterium]